METTDGALTEKQAAAMSAINVGHLLSCQNACQSHVDALGLSDEQLVRAQEGLREELFKPQHADRRRQLEEAYMMVCRRRARIAQGYNLGRSVISGLPLSPREESGQLHASSD